MTDDGLSDRLRFLADAHRCPENGCAYCSTLREAADLIDAAEEAADLLPVARRYLDPDATPQDKLSRIATVAARWQSVGEGGDDDGD